MSEGTDQHQGFSTPDLAGAVFLFQSHSSFPPKRVFVAHLSSLMNLKSVITKAHLPSLNQRLKIVLTNVGGRVPSRGDKTSRDPYRGCVLSAGVGFAVSRKALQALTLKASYGPYPATRLSHNVSGSQSVEWESGPPDLPSRARDQ